MNKKTIHTKSLKTFIILLLAIVLCVMLSGCSDNDQKQGTKSKFNYDPNTLSVCLASEPLSIDPALNSTSDGASMILHLFSGIAHWDKDENGNFVMTADAAESLPDAVANADGTYTYTYKIRQDAKWADGKPLTAKDFIFSWNRAASPEIASDFTSLFDTIVGYEEMWEDNPPENAHLAMTEIDEKTFSVTVTSLLPYWNELMGFATFMPVRSDIVDDEGIWATKPETYYCNGPYTMTDWAHNSVITMKKNETYYDASEIKMPCIKWFLSDNTNNQLTNFKNGDWQYIKSPPSNEIVSLVKDYPNEYHSDPMVGLYFTNWQVNFDLSPVGGRNLNQDEQSEVRNAINLMLDRNYIVNNVTRGGQTPANTLVPSGVKDWDGITDFRENSGHNKDFYGYFPTDKKYINQTYDEAVNTLKKYYKFDENNNIVDFPTLTYIYNTNEAHKAIAEYYQNVLSSIGIKMNLENQEWATFLATKKTGEYSLCKVGWTGDYCDPISFLNLFLTNAGNNSAQIGKKNTKSANWTCYNMDLSDISGYENKSVFNGTWAQTYDVIISYIKSETNEQIRSQLMHKAEDMIMATGTLCPIYNYTSTYMLKNYVKGFYMNSLDEAFFMYTSIE